MKKYFRWPVFVILALLIIVALVPAFSWLHTGKQADVHAAGTPTITPSVSTVHPTETIAMTGQGWAANDKVDIELDDIAYGPEVGTLTCDSSGNCSGTITLPPCCGLQGQHTLYGLGSTQAEETAQATITINPHLFPAAGGPGASVSVQGSAFTAGETVQVYWGSNQKGQLEGSATTDGAGNLSFTFYAPAGLASGYYPVTVIRANQAPHSLSMEFHVTKPKLIVPAGMLSGQSIQVQFSGFQANEQVTLSWNVGGGETFATLQADEVGSDDEYVQPYVAPIGTYTITATGKTSGLQATSSINVGPGITLNPYLVNPGGSITVSGGGFTPYENVTVYIQNVAHSLYQTATDGSGAFQIQVIAPTTYRANTSYYVYAVNDAGSEQAKALLQFEKPYISAGTDNNGFAHYGDPMTITGQGFLADEHVRLYWNYKQTSQLLLATVLVAPDGTFSLRTTVQSTPATLSFAVIGAKGVTSKLAATYYFETNPGLVLTPAVGKLGKTVNLKGGSFGSNETVTITFLSGNAVATPTTNVAGAFSVSFTIPPTLNVGGSIYIFAKGNTTHVEADTTYTVPSVLTISPTKGPEGTTITASGTYFTANNSVTLYWYDPVAGTLTVLGYVTASSAGAFTTTVPVPTNLISGRVYTVAASYSSFLTTAALAKFTAQ